MADKLKLSYNHLPFIFPHFSDKKHLRIFRPYERSQEELELVYEELLHVKALSHLSTMVKRELTSVIRFEQHQYAGTVLFHQGEEGKSWYIILKGSVDVNIIGKVS